MAAKLFKIFLIGILAAGLLCAPALAVTVEQAQAVMPVIDVYLYEDAGDLTGLSAEDVTASLDGTPLEVGELTRSEQGIFYVYMLDVSASIPASHFSAAIEAIRSAYSRLREQDLMALIAFGDEVTLLLRGGESRSQAEAALDSLTPSNANTKFYEAMDSLVELVGSTDEMRRVAVVISDGIDDSDDGLTRSELETTLLQSGVSVSAMCIDSAAPESVEAFREVIETSGGQLYTFGYDNATDVLQSLLDRLDGGWLLRLRAENNLADGHTGELAMTFGDAAVTCPVTLERWAPDETPPVVKSAAYDASVPCIHVVYSEPVSGADVTTAYQLSSDKGPGVAISSVEAVDAASYRLMLSAPAAEGEALSLSINGPADISMEANPVTPYSQTVLAAQAAPEPSPTPAAEPLISGTTIVILAVAAVALAAAGVLIVSLTKKKPGDKPKKERKGKNKTPAEKTGATFIFEKKDKD